MEDVGVFYGRLWSILRPCGILYDHLVYFWPVRHIFPFWYVVPRTIWQPGASPQPLCNGQSGLHRHNVHIIPNTMYNSFHYDLTSLSSFMKLVHPSQKCLAG
jgi:hypothetical protein